MKKFLLTIVALILIGCQDDGADITINVSPSELKVGDTAYLSGKIDATSSITQDDIDVTFTDSVSQHSSFFTLLGKDSIDSEKIYIDKNNYNLSFVVGTNATPGNYTLRLTARVGGESPSATAPFSVISIPNSATIDVNLAPSSANAGDTIYFAGVVQTSSPITEDELIITFSDSQDKHTTGFTLLEKEKMNTPSDKIFIDQNNYRLGFVIDAETAPGNYSAHFIVDVNEELFKSQLPFTVQ